MEWEWEFLAENPLKKVSAHLSQRTHINHHYHWAGNTLGCLIGIAYACYWLLAFNPSVVNIEVKIGGLVFI